MNPTHEDLRPFIAETPVLVFDPELDLPLLEEDRYWEEDVEFYPKEEERE